MRGSSIEKYVVLHVLLKSLDFLIQSIFQCPNLEQIYFVPFQQICLQVDLVKQKRVFLTLHLYGFYILINLIFKG